MDTDKEILSNEFAKMKSFALSCNIYIPFVCNSEIRPLNRLFTAYSTSYNLLNSPQFR